MRVLPVMTQRADVRLKDTGDANKRVTRWQRIALEAAKQSGRARVPEVRCANLIHIAHRKQTQENSGGLFMFSERGRRTTCRNTHAHATTSRPLIAAGSLRGGWADEEIFQARAGGCRS